jgi:hydroxyacylglutathione hydrolase
MFFHQRFIPGLAIYSYLVADEKSKQAAVIDPTRDIDEYLRIAKEQGLRITHILETHVHADFVSGSAELKARLGGSAQVVVSKLGGPEWTPPYADQTVANGDSISLGSVRLQAVHSPGHTLEHVSWAVYDEERSKDTPWLILTGDFLFVGDVGRPDLLGAEAQRVLAHQLYQSVFQVIPGLPDFTEVYPGHGAGSLCGKALGSRNATTVGFERRFNAALVKRPENEWIQSLLSGMPIAPPYFRRMKQVNRTGPKIIGLDLPGQKRISAQDIHNKVCDRCLVLDVRPKEAFAAAHIPGSINIPLGANLPTWAGWVLPYDTPINLVVEHPNDVPGVVTHLLRVGLDDIQGYLEGGIDAWEMAGYPLARVETISVHDLAQQLKSGAKLSVVDVRTENEWNSGHIEGAIHIHGGQLQERFAEVPRDRPVAVVCGSGYRASIASSFLKREGFDKVLNVIGGIAAWKSAGLPTTKA